MATSKQIYQDENENGFIRYFRQLKFSLRDPVLLISVICVSIIVIMFIIIPMFSILKESLFDKGSFSLNAYIKIFKTRFSITIIGNTLKLGLIVGIIGTAVAFLFAYATTYLDIRHKKFFRVLSILPMISPPIRNLIGSYSPIWKKRVDYVQSIRYPARRIRFLGTLLYPDPFILPCRLSHACQPVAEYRSFGRRSSASTRIKPRTCVQNRYYTIDATRTCKCLSIDLYPIIGRFWKCHCHRWKLYDDGGTDLPARHRKL
ncbi:hypothetical protein SDC9_103081 [bioreactor metagenome]|uniref:ABC transmembrane type-1 domain-containing protein n=1 Tax=bioreactor metagenome TaxID=1076179 RepID=A0A645AT75_9ZZZZ